MFFNLGSLKMYSLQVPEFAREHAKLKSTYRQVDKVEKY